MIGGRLGSAWHLAKRFVTSLSTKPPPVEAERWARGQLLPGEVALWARMSNPDRRHAIGVARAVVDELGARADRPVIAAALLHDSGKVASDLGTLPRVGATVLWAVIDPDRAPGWARRPGHDWLARVARYRLHPELGAELLVAAGSDPLTAAWAREHHLPPSAWTLPTDVATTLKACDDD